MSQNFLTLFSSEGCHLCEQAAALLQQVLPEQVVRKVDVTDTAELKQAYGERIPVLKKQNGSELGWPFDASQLQSWLNEV